MLLILEQNEKKIIAKIKEAAATGCQIILFHEGCLSGYPNGEQIKTISFEQVRQAEKNIRALANELHIAVLLGSASKEKINFTTMC